METLAYLHLAEDYENPEAKELNLKGLKRSAVTGIIGAACVTGGVVSIAASASACGYYGGYYGAGYYGGGYYGYRSHYRPYYPRYNSYRHYYRPYYY